MFDDRLSNSLISITPRSTMCRPRDFVLKMTYLLTFVYNMVLYISMYKKQKEEKSLVELRYDLATINLITISMVAFPALWAFLGCTLQVYMELDGFSLPYMGIISAIFFPLAAISGWFALRTKRQINEQVPKGGDLTSPIFRLIVGKKEE